MSARAFLDTNVVVYLFDSRDRIKQQRAERVLERDADPSFAISTQVLSEFYVTVTRKLAAPLDAQAARAAVGWLSDYPVVSIDASMVHAAIDTATAHRLSYWDALIVEAAVRAGCDRILTEDLASGSTIRGVRIENPFAADQGDDR